MVLTFQSDRWFYLNEDLSEVRKVNYLVMSIHPDKQLWWRSHVNDQFRERSPTNVYVWAESLLGDLHTRAIDAHIGWDKAEMRQTQATRGFSPYLSGLESQFPFKLSEEQKKFTLLAKVPERVRIEWHARYQSCVTRGEFVGSSHP